MPLRDPTRARPCSVAKFLETRGEAAKALEVARDPDYRFELAGALRP